MVTFLTTQTLSDQSYQGAYNHCRLLGRNKDSLSDTVLGRKVNLDSMLDVCLCGNRKPDLTFGCTSYSSMYTCSLSSPPHRRYTIIYITRGPITQCSWCSYAHTPPPDTANTNVCRTLPEVLVPGSIVFKHCTFAAIWLI